LSLAGVPADAHIQNRPTGEREDSGDACQRKAEAGFLRVGLRIIALVFRRSGPRDRGPVLDVNAPAFPKPLRIYLGIQRAPRVASNVRKQASWRDPVLG
jgi:hypothetical protein